MLRAAAMKMTDREMNLTWVYRSFLFQASTE